MATGAELKRIREATNISAQKLADLAGIDVERLRKWEQRDQDPRDSDAEKLLLFFEVNTLSDLRNVQKVPDTKVEESAVRYGRQAKSGLQSSIIKTTEGDINGILTRNPLLRAKKSGTGEVPYYETDFVAGNAISFFEDNVERPAYTMLIPGYAGCVAFPSYGDSMENLIKGGSILFGRKLEDWKSYIEFGQIYGVVMKDHRRFLKYVRRADDAKNCFLLRSENAKYEDFEVPKNKIHNIWLIEGWMLKRT